MAGTYGNIVIQTQVLSFVIVHVKFLAESMKFLQNEMDAQGTFERCLGNEIVHRVDLGILIKLVG